MPFDVPAGTERVTLTFAYTGKEQHTALDLGLLDPAELRCWSGGNKSLLTVGIADATPSCLPGVIPPGKWNVLIGVPNIRPNVQSHYTVHVYFSTGGAVASEPAVLNAPLRVGPAWYRGDLHMHTAQSDGECPSQTGKMAPCPVYFSVDAAARRGLDFIAITDHNASSQYNPMRELQPYFDKVLLIPGREITTFQGHINFLGTTDFVDFRLGSKEVPDVNTLLRNADSLGGLTSINHPGDPSGEICMGCGWTPSSKVDMHLLTAVEAVNGGSEQYGIPNIPFWDKQLNNGCRLAGIGGSDNHRPMQPLDGIGSIGSPTTVVYATRAIDARDSCRHPRRTRLHRPCRNPESPPRSDRASRRSDCSHGRSSYSKQGRNGGLRFAYNCRSWRKRPLAGGWSTSRSQIRRGCFIG